MEKAPHHVSDEEPFYCPSWARTRTLLIQRLKADRINNVNLPGFIGEPSIGAGFSKRGNGIQAGETDIETD